MLPSDTQGNQNAHPSNRTQYLHPTQHFAQLPVIVCFHPRQPEQHATLTALRANKKCPSFKRVFPPPQRNVKPLLHCAVSPFSPYFSHSWTEGKFSFSRPTLVSYLIPCAAQLSQWGWLCNPALKPPIPMPVCSKNPLTSFPANAWSRKTTPEE